MKAGLGLLLLLGLGVLAVVALPGGVAGDRPISIEDVDAVDIDIADPNSVPDPTTGSERLPDGYRLAFPRDAIAPVYDPTFVRGDDVDWADQSLIIGLEIDGRAKAYPVSFLNRREMVVDRLAGIPILVSW